MTPNPSGPAVVLSGAESDRSGLFAEVFGSPPAGCWTAPGRVNLIGEYTDLNEGHVLPLAISQSCRAWVAERGDGRLRVFSALHVGAPPVEMAIDGQGRVAGWAMYPLAVARALNASGLSTGGADILVDSDVPVGAGLSSSASLECSVALALCELYGHDLDAMAVARVAQRAENEFVGMPCGLMDQAASMCSVAGHALLLDTRSLAIEHVPLDLRAVGLDLVVVDTGVKHDLVGSAYAGRRRSCEEAARLLGVRALRDIASEDTEGAIERLRRAGEGELARRAAHVLYEERRVLAVVGLLREGRAGDIGPVLSAGHRSLRDDFEVSSPELDLVVEVAGTAGARGARLTGAGFGGSVIVLVDQEAKQGVLTAVQRAFLARDWRPPRSFSVVAAAGARRAR